MKRFRFNIASLLVVVLLVAIGFAALREASDLWESGVFALTLGVLLIAILSAVHRTDSRRAFWLGFSLFGAAYLGLSLVPPIESRLITTKVLALLESKVSDRPIVISGRVWDTWSRNQGQNNPSVNSASIAFSPQGNLVASGNEGVIRVWNLSGSNLLGTWSGTTENFMRIGHSLLALITALVGGQLSRRLYGKDREPVEVSVIPETSNSGGSGV
jgi:hypothetical protein